MLLLALQHRDLNYSLVRPLIEVLQLLYEISYETQVSISVHWMIYLLGCLPLATILGPKIGVPALAVARLQR